MADLCRSSVEGRRNRPRPIADFVAQNWLLSTVAQSQAAAPFLATYHLDRFRGNRLRDREVFSTNALIYSPPNIGLTTPDDFASRSRRTARTDDVAGNLLANTLRTAVQVAPFSSAHIGSIVRRLAFASDTQGNQTLLLSARLFADNGGTQVIWRARFADLTVPNLVVRSALSAPVPLFSIDLPQLARQKKYADDSSLNLLAGIFGIAAQAVLPVASGEWPVPKIKRYSQADGAPNIALTTLALPQQALLPFANVEWNVKRIARFGVEAQQVNALLQTQLFVPTELNQRTHKWIRTDDGFGNLLQNTLAQIFISLRPWPLLFTVKARAMQPSIDYTQNSTLLWNVTAPILTVTPVGNRTVKLAVRGTLKLAARDITIKVH